MAAVRRPIVDVKMGNRNRMPVTVKPSISPARPVRSLNSGGR